MKKCLFLLMMLFSHVLMIANDTQFDAMIYYKDANYETLCLDVINTKNGDIFFGETNTGDYMICFNTRSGDCSVAFALDLSFPVFKENKFFCSVLFFQDYRSMHNEKENMFEGGVLAIKQIDKKNLTFFYTREDKIIRIYEISLAEDDTKFSNFLVHLYTSILITKQYGSTQVEERQN